VTTTASIYFNKIRTDFPQAGKDNDSQGFRDNFRNIFNAFSATNADLESLQLNAVTLGGNNDFGYNNLKKPILQSYGVKTVDYTTSPTSGNISINFLESNYQKFSLTPGTTTFTVDNWPSQGYANVTLSITPTTTSTTLVTFGGSVTAIGSLTLPTSVTATSITFFDLWTDNGGTSLFVTKRG